MTKSQHASLSLAEREEASLLSELLIRRRARANILDYVNAIDIPGKPTGDDPDTEFFQPIETTVAEHHRLILSKLDEVSKTRHGRLMIFCPPGSAKSTYASVVFPSRYLGEKSGRKLILASYGDDLARKMGRRTRSIVKQSRYKGIYGTELAADSQAAQEWALSNGSEYMACGIMAGITGNRANGIIIDDPIKGREQADSETIRQKTWDAYQDDLLTRLIPGGFVVLVQTRWHEDDLAGRILPEKWKGESGAIKCRDGNVWEVICLQACCEVENDPLGRKYGEYLWPQWFDQKHWAQFKSNSRTWSALYQQMPSPPEGSLFKPDRINIVDVLPVGLRAARGWDFAATTEQENKKADWTVGGKVGMDDEGRVYIMHVNRFRGSPLDVEKSLVNTAKMDGYGTLISAPQDPGQAGKSQAQYFARLLAGYVVEFSPETGSKETRASPLASQMEAGNVYMLRADWNQELTDEMRKFPNGSHDDQIDGLSRAFNHLTSTAYDGEVFFSLANMLVDGAGVEYPEHCDAVFATVHTTVRSGQQRDSISCCYWAVNKVFGTPLILLDWDILEAEGNMLEAWLPEVTNRGHALAVQCASRTGYIGAWVQNKFSGAILIEHAARLMLPVHVIESGLADVGNDERALSVSGYVYQGKVKLSEYARAKEKQHKSKEVNHFISQFCGYRVGAKDEPDELLTAGCYGIAIALGNAEGY